MATHADTQAAKRGSANHKTADHAADNTAHRGATATHAREDHPLIAPVFWSQWMATQEHVVDFGIRRAERYRRFFHDMGACANPTDAMRICAEAAQSCLEDYMDEAKRLKATPVTWPSFADAVTPSTTPSK